MFGRPSDFSVGLFVFWKRGAVLLYNWIEVFKLFCKYESLVLGALRVYAEGGQDVGEQGCVEHAA